MDLATRVDTFANDDQTWLGSARGLQSTQSIALAVAAFTAGTHYPSGFFPSGLALAKATSGTYSGLYVPVVASVNEVQLLTMGGAPTGGTFTLTFDGQTTAAIAFNAIGSAVQTALEGLSNINPGDVTVTGVAGGPWTVTFLWGEASSRVGKDVPAITANNGSLTGGTSPAVTISTSTGGGSGVTDGSDQLAGFLAFAVRAPYSTSTTKVSGALLDTGRVITANLPSPGIPANAAATNPRFVYV